MADAYDTCAQCAAPMAPRIGRGRPRKYCSPACSALGAAGITKLRAFEKCSIDGCVLPANRVGFKLCETHYYRLYRNGTTDYVGNALPGNREHSGGYVLAAAPGHPRALGGYRAYEHRVVFYDARGEGPFDCHWCGCVVTWDDMHVDHVDDNKENNALSNLVASCPLCNQQRGREKMKRTVRQRYGLTINGETMTLNEWAAKARISRSSIVSRLKKGWEPERAVFEPRGKRGPPAQDTPHAGCCL